VSSSEIFTTEAAKDVKFKDFDKLQDKIRDLLSFDDHDDGNPVIAFEDGILKLRGHEDDVPGDYAETYECFGLAGSMLVAEHLVQGRILIRLSPEGWPDRLHLITPGKAEEVDVAKLLGF
jgi:hypothetical protein